MLGIDDDVLERPRAEHDLAHGAVFQLLLVKAETAGSIALRIKINQQRLLATFSQKIRHVDGSRGLTYPTFLIGH